MCAYGIPQQGLEGNDSLSSVDVWCDNNQIFEGNEYHNNGINVKSRVHDGVQIKSCVRLDFIPQSDCVYGR